MKKKTLILIFCCIICFVPNIVFADDSPDKDIERITSMVNAYYTSYFDTAEELIKKSNYIVKATILPESENLCLHPIWGYTKTKIKIDEVYKGNIEKDEVVTLMEPYFDYYDEEYNVIYECHSELYDKSEVGKEYLLFLTKSSNKNNNNYYLINEYYGRYPVPTKERGAVSVENMEPEDFDLYDGYIEDYKKIYSEIINIYQQVF